MHAERNGPPARFAGAWRLALAAFALAIALAIALAACVPRAVPAVFTPGDMRPPAVTTWGPVGSRSLIINFDEELADIMPGVTSSPGAPVAGCRLGGDGRSLVVDLGSDQEPGASYAVSGIVADASGNQSSFVLPYWGHNPDPPRMLCNELLTEGTSTHPDAIEFYVAAGGQCAGLAFFVGTPESFDLRYIFPRLVVAAGDFIVLHLKPQGLETEVDECLDKAAAAGLDATAGAWDLWYRGGNGALSGKNGALSLCVSPNGGFLDAVLYSERTAESDTAYGGFGSAALRDRVALIVAADAWQAPDPPRPEDCARSTGTTSTRTICRSSSSGDTGTGADWHIVPTKGSSLGLANSDAVYVP